MSWLHVILDNGHGKETRGKCSPVRKDGTRLYEWLSNRKLVRLVANRLDRKGVSYDVLVPETSDVPLYERANRANHIARQHGVKNTLVVSIHSNAGGGTGIEVFTSPGTTLSDDYAELFYEEWPKMGTAFPARKDTTDGDSDKEEDFAILRKTLCPAVLVEALFMDSAADLDYLMSSEGKELLADWITSAILRCVEHHERIMR
uniref:N-acetylmuramoyl-L-alanine amidase n=1 Tax=Alistipes sp. TaxID=1872444 RepID=UPI004056DD6C